MAASSASPVVSPAVGWMPVTPRKKWSALMRFAASTAAAPHATAECLKSWPPMRKTSTAWSSSAAAIVGLWVMIVPGWVRGSAATRARLVVPPSRMAVAPGSMRAAAAAPTRRLLSGATPVRAA